MVTGAGDGAAIENIAPVRSMRVDGPGAWRSSKFSTNSADTMCIAARVSRTATADRWAVALARGRLDRLCHGDSSNRPSIAEGPADGLHPARAPYETTALEPYLSAETFEYHYGKHHKAYVDTLNRMIEGTDDENASRSRRSSSRPRASCSTRPPRCGTTPVLELDGAGRRWRPLGRRRRRRSTRRSAATTSSARSSRRRPRRPVRLRLDVAHLDGGKLAVMSTSNADLPMKHGQTAVLTCDVWEHAYYIDYRNARPELRRRLPRPPDQLEAARGRPRR